MQKEPSTMDNQHSLVVKEELKNINEENTTNSIVINEMQNIPLNPIEAENKINSTWSLDTLSAIPQIYNDENQLQDMDEEIHESSNENFSVVTDFKPLELLELDYSTKPYFQDILNEVSSELNFKNYSTMEVNDTFQIFKENSSNSPFVKVYSIENHDITLKETNLLNKLRFERLNEEEKEHTMNLILSNQDRFDQDGQKLGVASTVMHRIPTIDDIPINVKQYKIPISLKDEVERQVQELLKDGIIKPSTSPYNSPLWIVPKKMDVSGKQKWRLVSDFRLLNGKTISDGHPLPDITQIIDQVGGHRYYTTLDLAKGFEIILMDPRGSYKTAFSTAYGHYEYVRMTFGLKNAPPTFERFIDVIFKDLQGKIMYTFIDDIVVFADTL